MGFNHKVFSFFEISKTTSNITPTKLITNAPYFITVLLVKKISNIPVVDNNKEVNINFFWFMMVFN